MKENQTKEQKLLESRFLELSRIAYQREIVTYSDFLNLNEQNILHTLPKESLYTGYVSFGGFDFGERHMGAFFPDALYLRYEKKTLVPAEIGYPFTALSISPLHRKIS